MSESGIQSEQDSKPVEAAEQPVLSAGALLKAAREASGLHIAALAVALKVPVKRLEALEADRFDALPDAVFVRGLASSVCRALKIDPTPVLARLPQTHVPRLKPDEEGINTPFRAPGDGPSVSLSEQVSRPWALASLALLAATLVVIFFPTMERESPAEAAAVTSEAVTPALALAKPEVLTEEAAPIALPSTPVVEAPVANAASGTAAVPAPAPVVAAVPSPATVPAAPVPVAPASANKPGAVAVAAAPVVSAATAPTAAPASSTTTPGATSTGLVVFKARGTSWVEVQDAKGVVQLRRNLTAGETVGVSGALPLAVIVGRVDVIDVQVRGKAFGLTELARENVARFEVK